jgi:hypothetical protein
MWKKHPVIELKGYRRLVDVERRIMRSPVGWTLVLIGMGGAIYGVWSLREGLTMFPPRLLIGYVIFLATYLGLLAYLYGYRFRTLKCPGCEQLMQAGIADLDEGGWQQRWLRAVEVNGRFYRRPYDEDDRRPWVRLMKLVRACPQCRTFVDCSHVSHETCTEDELTRLQDRSPAG